MVNANEFKTKSNTLNATIVETDEIFKNSLIVLGVVVEKMRDGKEKLGIAFEGLVNDELLPKLLILNQTNLKIMVDAKGTDTTKWTGTKVKLTLIPSSFNGQPTKSILIVV